MTGLSCFQNASRGSRFQITLSDNAVDKLKELITKNGTAEDTYLRMYVAGGGCSGFRCGLALDNKVHEGDEVVQASSVKVVIDPTSKEYLEESSIDYVESVAGSGFMVNSPNNWSTCGCGQSFNRRGETAPDPAEGHEAHAHNH